MTRAFFLSVVMSEEVDMRDDTNGLAVLGLEYPERRAGGRGAGGSAVEIRNAFFGGKLNRGREGAKVNV